MLTLTRSAAITLIILPAIGADWHRGANDQKYVTLARLFIYIPEFCSWGCVNPWGWVQMKRGNTLVRKTWTPSAARASPVGPGRQGRACHLCKGASAAFLLGIHELFISCFSWPSPVHPSAWLHPCLPFTGGIIR